MPFTQVEAFNARMVGSKFMEFRELARTSEWHRVNPSVITVKSVFDRNKERQAQETLRVKFMDQKISETKAISE